MPNFLDPSTWIPAIVSGAAADALKQLANEVAAALARVIVAVGTLWIGVPSPSITGDGNGNPIDASTAAGASGFSTLLGWVEVISLALCMMS
ncbi:hypothetical protein ACFVUP_38440, partial [Streptomyces bacillaris]|uniref:hypothetical protein n=1 Tax=Streptomyces bacillaris TaxID=68179 RepID=UPI0036DD5430